MGVQEYDSGAAEEGDGEVVGKFDGWGVRMWHGMRLWGLCALGEFTVGMR
jgi:hypothetical protein